MKLLPFLCARSHVREIFPGVKISFTSPQQCAVYIAVISLRSAASGEGRRAGGTGLGLLSPAQSSPRTVWSKFGIGTVLSGGEMKFIR